MTNVREGPARVLVVDDEAMMCNVLADMVGRLGHEASCVFRVSEALETLGKERFDIVFLDVNLPDGSGLDLVSRLQLLPEAPEVIIITGFGDPQGAELAIKSGAWDYLQKTADIGGIRLSLMRALKYRQEKRTRKLMVLRRERILGRSAAITGCLELVAQAAASGVTVLIAGETGTGKELFAGAIHENSTRAARNFVVVDCAALPEALVESMLFGHVKGAFTGADKDSEGLIRQADGGTLFLDEVGELPLALQRSFLRVLQEHRFRPLGSHKELESDFRLVAATNRDLEAMVGEGRFRQDLLYRLRSLVINLPPLRERPGDIRELAVCHVDRLCAQYQRGPKGLSPDFLAALETYEWPGNVRELVNSLEMALVLAGDEPTLYAKHLPLAVRVQAARASLTQGGHEDHVREAGVSGTLPPLREYRRHMYGRYARILRAMAGTDIRKACEISGLSRSRLYAFLQEHEPDESDHSPN